MNAPLNHAASYPIGLAFVLKLHRDADPANGRCEGRIEHIASGRQADFGSVAELCGLLPALLAGHAQQDPNATVL